MCVFFFKCVSSALFRRFCSPHRRCGGESISCDKSHRNIDIYTSSSQPKNRKKVNNNNNKTLRPADSHGWWSATKIKKKGNTTQTVKGRTTTKPHCQERERERGRELRPIAIAHNHSPLYFTRARRDVHTPTTHARAGTPRQRHHKDTHTHPAFYTLVCRSG